ncbi:PAC2 family protein [Tengunoibacter tsumagoiensis]|uniref:PAC2 family protein n=1 Tax=Tengunoibacter tsumagoiensis TaxID=2014871 RepID=A0A402A253_9CHLR|nr:PAC2 family protein [Tengunoibacter tsumagoiensis]GCE13136.1 hypothetical protein KTT_29950 [Tengunoibacter tsumagoiensis]
MSLIHYYNQPELRDPVVLVAFGGWNDAAEAATSAVKFLVDRWSSEKIAEIEAEEFFVFTEARPTIRYEDGIQHPINWPLNQFFAQRLPEGTRDVILFNGIEPHLKWKSFSSTFLDVCKHFNVSEVLFLGALLAEIPHSADVPIIGTSTNEEMQERLLEMAIRNSDYEGATGILGVLQDACRREQIPAASLWASASHYLAATPNVKVTAALLTYINQFLSFGLDLKEVHSEAVRFEERVTALVAQDPEASAYVRRLEEQIANGIEAEDEEGNAILHNPDRPVGTGPLPSADSVIRHVEELLREERQNGNSAYFDDDEETE